MRPNDYPLRILERVFSLVPKLRLRNASERCWNQRIKVSRARAGKLPVAFALTRESNMSGDKFLSTEPWNEAEFLAELEERSGATAREVAEGLLRWVTRQVTDVAWGLGSKPRGGVPFIQHGNTKYLICRMATDGHFVFRFDYLSANAPFSNESLMGQLRDKIKEDFGDDVFTKGELGNRARIAYEKLTTSDAREKLESTVLWLIKQVKVDCE